MDLTSQIVSKYPYLRSLYIPQKGEIIRWGTGYAITVQSPLQNNEMPMLMVISLNGGIWGPFDVKNVSGMGPYESIEFEDQQKVINGNYFGRIPDLFAKHPDAKEAWEIYCKEQKAKNN